jgi:hypothetical protein
MEENKMSVALPAEIVRNFAKLRVTNIIVCAKKNKKSPDDLAAEILDVLEKECHFTITDD